MILQKTPYSFDVSVWEFFCPLWAGATLVLAKPGGHKDPYYLRTLIEQVGVTATHFVPSMLQSFVAVLEAESCPSLRLIFCSGEALPAATVQQAYKRLPHMSLHNLYGPTEAAVEVTGWACPVRPESVSIGSPKANNRIYILDANGQPVPVGAVGELIIGGVQVARGYLNRADLTAERFLADPFATEAHARMYRSGDLCRWRADGTIEYLGRNDDQVKIRGFRVELDEIASALLSCTGVAEAVVTASPDQQLLAYYRTNNNGVTVDELKAQLQQRLPEHIVPAAYIELAQIPLMPNGKVDRRALPAPDDSAFARTEYQAPQGELEQALASIWQDLLGIERVGRHDHFFELGGHSLLAVRLIAALQAQGLNVPARTVFEHTSLADFAATIERFEQTEVPENRINADTSQITPDMLPLVELTQANIDWIVSSVPGGVRQIQDIYPLTPLQEGVLYHYLLAESNDPYLNSSLLAFDTGQRLEAFIASLNRVIARHDILRTTVRWEGLPQPVQVVLRNATLTATHVRLTPETGDAADQLFSMKLNRLDLHQAPLLNLLTARDEVNDRWLLCMQHNHLCIDHTTLDILLNEIQADWRGELDQLPASIPFRNHVAQVRAREAVTDDEIFFRQQLADVDEPTLPYGLTDSAKIEEAILPLPDTLARRIRQQARQNGISTASLFHLAWGRLISVLSGRDDIVFGTVLLGRLQDGGEQIPGVFINTLPLRLTLTDVTVRTALDQTHRRLTDLLSHEHASLTLAQQCSGVAASQPLFSALLNYRHNTMQAGDDDRWWHGIETLEIEERTSYPLTLSVNDELNVGFSLKIQADHRLGGERAGEMMLHVLTQLIDALEQSPEQPLHQLSVLLEAERQQVLYGFNNTKTECPTNLCVHERFEQQAARHPERTALVFEDQSLNYAELNIRANRLAHYLRELGISADDRVAICTERNHGMIICVLATLKAGAACVPLDPEYPQTRLAYMLKDSAPGVILVDQQGETALTNLTDPATVLHLTQDAERWATSPAHSPAPTEIGLTPDHLAYVIYTSGSTGQPKGVAMPHAPLVNLLHWQAREHAAMTTLQFASFGFDVAFQEILSTLTGGGQLVMINNQDRLQMDRLLDTIEQHAVERVFLPVAVLQTLAVTCTQTQRTLPVREVITAGERLVISDEIHDLCQRSGSIRLHNQYGPAETHVVTEYQCSGHAADWPQLPPIGYPVDNVRLYILDAHQQPVPQGVSGELYIAGVGVARGYLNQPELTAERFLNDPFSAEPNARMYRTGDLGRWLADGSIEYLGRNDFQVKIRGFRIEPGEVESVLQDCDGVREAVVLAQDHRLVAYYTVSEDSLTVEALKTQLARRLPAHMVPSAYVALDQIPLTQNGKVNRKALPTPDDSAFARTEYQAPQGEIEQALASIWQDLLGIERVGRQDNFFELGGHSLLAVRLVSHIRSRLNRELPLARLFESPHLFELAATLDAADTQYKAYVAFRTGGSQRPLFVVPEATGELLYGPQLTAVIDTDIPVYGLLGPDRNLPGFKTLQGAAARYVSIIREVQPQGPYRLLGWSLGGTLAYEIAAQLIGQNQSVEFLGLLDTWAFPPGEASSSAEETLEQMSRAIIQSALTIRGEPLPTAALADCHDWQAYFALACDLGIVPADWSADYYRNWLQHRQDLLNAEYQPQPLPVQIDLLAAHDSLALAEPYLNWNRVLPQSSIRVTPVPGDHMSLFSASHVDTVGKQISARIQARTLVEPIAALHAHAPVITLQTGHSAGPVLICIPGAGDNVMSFMALTKAMPDNWQVLGLQPRGLLGGTAPHSSVEAAAQSYLDALKSASLNGPIHLLGHSFGGWGALELTRRLEQDGTPVASLTLVDSRAPHPATEHSDLQVLMRLIQLFEMQGTALALTESDMAALQPPQRLRYLHQRLIECGVMSASSRAQDLTAIFRVFAANLRTGYQPESLPEITPSLILAEDAQTDRMTGWQTLIPAIQLQRGSGNHVQLLKAPHVTLLADRVQRK
ncbi:MAG: amino acid adenylation domain-containing protein [Reinekea sp.]